MVTFQDEFDSAARRTYNIMLSDPETGINDNSQADQGLLKSRTISSAVASATGVTVTTPTINTGGVKTIEGVDYATSSVITFTVHSWTSGTVIPITITATLSDGDIEPFELRLRIV